MGHATAGKRDADNDETKCIHVTLKLQIKHWRLLHYRFLLSWCVAIGPHTNVFGGYLLTPSFQCTLYFPLRYHIYLLIRMMPFGLFVIPCWILGSNLTDFFLNTLKTSFQLIPLVPSVVVEISAVNVVLFLLTDFRIFLSVFDVLQFLHYVYMWGFLKLCHIGLWGIMASSHNIGASDAHKKYLRHLSLH